MSCSPHATEAGQSLVVVADDLHVAYGSGSRRRFGLEGFSAVFAPGITGLIGPNGAGKSTLLRTACGLLPPVRGTLRLGGMDPKAYVTAHGVGFLPETPPLPAFLTVREFLEGVLPGGRGGALPGGDPPALPGLGALLDRRLDSLSLGQRKKAALAASLLGSPSLLLLDEPTNGLDPMAVRELREVLTGLGRGGTTLIVSSHHLDELQRLADVLVFVRGGRALGSWTRAQTLDGFGSFDGLYEHVFLGRSA